MEFLKMAQNRHLRPKNRFSRWIFTFLDQYAGFGFSYSKDMLCTFFHINTIKNPPKDLGMDFWRFSGCIMIWLPYGPLNDWLRDYCCFMMIL